MSQVSRPRIIAAMPAYNEEQYVGSLVLKARKYVDEVIVFDDGSSDSTAEIARLAGATVLRHETNQGKGAAVRRILTEVRGRLPDVLVLLDADGQHNPDEIPRLVNAVLEGSDLVIGSRKAQASKTPFYRRIGQRLLSYSTGIASGGGKVSDSESGFRALSPRTVSEIDLTEDGFAVETEMIVKATKKGLKITEVPISNIYTRDGSTMNPVRHGVGVLGRVMAMVSERRPLFFFGIGGGVLAIFGIAAGVKVLRTFSDVHVLAVGTAVLSALLLIIAVLSVFTGIILNILTKSSREK